MKSTHDILASTGLAIPFQELEALYRSVEEAQSSFLSAIAARGDSFGCPPSCGICCEGFMPDLTRIEAAYLAFHIVSGKQDQDGSDDLRTVARELGLPADGRALPEGTCPFYDASRPGRNCLVYPARALICRSFAHSAMRNKNGEAVFTLCRRMPSPQGFHRRTMDGRSMLERYGALPPVMSDYSFRLAHLSGGSGASRGTLDRLLPPEIQRISLLLRYGASDDTSGDDAPKAA